MTAARSTLGSGRARTTNPASAGTGHTSSPTRRPGRPPPKASASSRRSSVGAADGREVRQAGGAEGLVRSAGCGDVSPTTRPGQQTAGVRRQPGRRPPQPEPQPLGQPVHGRAGASTTGGPRAASVATTSAPASAGASRPDADPLPPPQPRPARRPEDEDAGHGPPSDGLGPST